MRERSDGSCARRFINTFACTCLRGVVILAVWVLPLTTSLAQSCVEPPKGIIAWWPFDEASGTVATDIIGSNPGADVGSPIHVPGQVGNALSFNGSNYVGVVDSPLWAFGTQDFTVEFWANFSSPPGGSTGEPGAIFIGNDEGGGDRNKWFFAIGGGHLEFHINSPTLGPQFFPLVPFSPIVGQWYHLAVTRSGNTYTIYINGVAMGSAVNTNAVPNANAPLTIGMAEDIGFMHGALDEMTIYNQALSPAQLLSIAAAGSAGKCKNLTIMTSSLSSVQLGTFFSQQLQAIFGMPPYSWSVVSGSLPTGVTLSSLGVLGGIPSDAGEFSFTVGVTDGVGSGATKEFTLTDLVTLPPPSLRITKSGTLAVPGRTSDYFILVQNIGSSTATDTSVVEFLEPQNFTLLGVSPPALTDVATLAKAFIIPWNLPSLSPGQAAILSYQVEINPTVPIGETLTGTACTTADVVTTLGAAGACYLAAAKAVPSCEPCVSLCADYFAACAAVPALCIESLAVCGACMAETGCLKGALNTLGTCLGAVVAGLPCFNAVTTALGAIDPNQKTVSAGQFILPNQLLLYPIHYENVGTAAARDVFVTDVLDPNLDASTLQILTPGGSYNAATRTITWSLLGTDLQPGATADVLYQIKPLSGLASGTAVRNTATIKFDVFAPMTTNQVVNVVDSTPPTSSINPLPWRTMISSNFTVSWQGSDTIGSVANFTIFESVNGGPFSPYLQNTTDAQTNFTGQPGNTYGFISIATDTAGNVEVEQPVAEATILVSLPGDVNGDGRVDCADVALVKAAFGTKLGQGRYNKAADVNNDGAVNIFDLAFVTQHLPAGTVCH